MIAASAMSRRTIRSGSDRKRAVLLVVSCTLALAAFAAAPVRAADLVVYDDQLENGFQDWSWAEQQYYDPAYAGQHHAGTHSIRWRPNNWEGLYYHDDASSNVQSFMAVHFWIRGDSGGGQAIKLQIQQSGTNLGSSVLDPFLPQGGIPSGQWTEVTVPFSALGLVAGLFNELIFQANSAALQPWVDIDDISFLENTQPPPPPTPIAISVNPALDRHAISPFVYGVNWASTQQLQAIGYPFNRWGGNSITRYNWQLDVSNKAFDWFFINENGGGDPNQLPVGSDADVFITSSRGVGADVLLTLPTIGLTPKDRLKKSGFSIQFYGPQTSNECIALFGPDPANWPDWCDRDSGNGVCDGSNTTGFCQNGIIVGNNPADTSVAEAPTYPGDWLTFIDSRVGTPSNGGVRFFALDNEPMLWNSTHRDVHPTPPTYDEVQTKGFAIAQAVKSHDANAKVLGPDTWGWCDLFSSAADAARGNCLDGLDRQAHGGIPYVGWYLQQVCQYQQQHGVRLVDYVDVHFYPQGDVAGVGGNDSSEAEPDAERRLRSLKELYDPTWVSESWINDVVELVPRLRGWVAQYCPGTKIALTEYKWGPDNGSSGALAAGEVLAILGREQVDLASRWTVPDTGTRSEDAFKMFLDYDGAGARVTGDSVRATSADVDAVGAYAVASTTGPYLYLLLFNKDVNPREADVTIAGGGTGTAQLYRYDGATALGPAGSVAVSGGALTVTLPIRSATLAVVSTASSLIFADGFESGSTSAWSLTVP